MFGTIVITILRKNILKSLRQQNIEFSSICLLCYISHAGVNIVNMLKETTKLSESVGAKVGQNSSLLGNLAKMFYKYRLGGLFKVQRSKSSIGLC